MRARKPPMERFLALTVPEPNSGCLLWTGATNDKGYGQFRADPDGPLVYVHRWIYEQKVGPIPPGLQPDHLCRVSICCDETHYEIVTPLVNIQRAWRARKPDGECLSGHLYAITGKQKSGHCSECRRIYQRKTRKVSA